MGKAYSIQIQDETFQLLPSRAVYWPARGSLIVADLHWGKGETFRASGIAVPDALSVDELSRLTNVLIQTGARRLIILGDLIHAIKGVTPELRSRITDWRSRFEGEVVVTRGNHDRSWEKLPREWKIDWVKEWREDGFIFRHEHPETSESRAFVWSGHLHPTYRLSAAFDSLRLPCFYFEKRQRIGILPSFNFFTRGVEMTSSPHSRLFVSTGEKIIEICT